MDNSHADISSPNLSPTAKPAGHSNGYPLPHQTGVSQEAPTEEALTVDPIVSILAAFHCIPSDYHADLFNDFRDAAQSHDLRRLLDTISDWAATAELYSQPEVAADLQEATGGRKGVADWLHG